MKKSIAIQAGCATAAIIAGSFLFNVSPETVFANNQDNCNEVFNYPSNNYNNGISANTDIDDNRVNINVHSSDNNEKISITAKTGYIVTELDIDFSGGNTTWVTLGNGNKDHFNPPNGKEIGKYRAKVKKVCATPTPTPSPTPKVTPTPTPSPSPTPTPTPSPSPSPSPSPEPTPTPTPTPSPSPEITPLPSPNPCDGEVSLLRVLDYKVDPCPTPSPEPTEPPIGGPEATPSPAPDDGKSGHRSSLGNDNLQCTNTHFDAVMDVKWDGVGQKDVKVVFYFNGERIETRSDENGRARTQYPIGSGVLIAEAEGYPTQSQVIDAPACGPVILDPDGSVLGAITLASTGSQDLYMAAGIVGSGLSLIGSTVYGYIKKKQNA